MNDILHLLTFFHFTCLVIDGYTLYWVILNLSPPIWGGLSVMLTFWGHVFNTVYFAVALVHDIQALLQQSESKAPQKFRSALFSVCFCLSAIVCMLFWALYFHNRANMFSKDHEKYYPYWVNIVQHLATFIFILIELFADHQENIPIKQESAFLLGLVLLYLVWNTTVGLVDKFPYPFQREMGIVGHFVFDVAAILLMTVVAYSKRFLIQKIYPEKISSPKQNKAKAS